MPFVPLFATKEIVSMALSAGSGADLTSPTGFMLSIGVDYVNEGRDDEPPTLSYANQVDDSETGPPTNLGDKVGVMLPLSAEGVLVAPDQGFIQYRHPRWSRY